MDSELVVVDQAEGRRFSALTQTTTTAPLAMAPQPPRARPSARKRMDDSAFVGPSGVKRTAPDKPEGSDARTKRKRVDQPNPNIIGNTSYAGVPTTAAMRRPVDDDDASSVVRPPCRAPRARRG